MKYRFLQLISVFILVLPLLTACGSLENQASSNLGDVGQKAMVAAQAQKAAQQATQLPSQSGKTTLLNSTNKTLSNRLSDLPERITTVQRDSKFAPGSWWQNITKKISEQQIQKGGGSWIQDKQPKPY